MTEYDPETLAQFDGKDGRPVYIAHQGKVYDVSNSKLWKTGTHMRRHPAGKDLTSDIQAAPHGPEMLERVPQVGVLKEAGPARDTGPVRDTAPFIEGLLRRYPMLKRHPHPMTVHFPIVFMMAVPAFNVLYLLTGAKSFEVTSLHCLAAGLLFTPLVMLTGLLTWWLNYGARPLRPVNIKIAVSTAMLLTAMGLFSWRAVTPDLMDSFGVAGAAYFLLTLSLIPMAAVIGWHGAKLTFPFERG
jgi:predicted heme/steroid binding protein/uncharacterized membrane protein